MDVNLRMSDYQRDVLESKDPFIISINGIGSGKTYCASIVAVVDLLKGRSSLVTAQNYKCLKDVLFVSILDVLNQFNIKYYYNISDSAISLTKKSSSHARIIGRSAEAKEGIRGITNVSNWLGDEVALYDPEVFTIATGRLRGEGSPHIRLFTTSRGGSNWVSRLTKREDVITKTTTIFENPYVTDEQRNLIVSNYEVDSDLYNQEIMGRIINSDFTTAILKLTDFSPTCIIASNNLTNLTLSIDFARDGVDKTVMLLRNQSRILERIILSNADTSVIMSNFQKLEVKYGADNIKYIYYDSTGGFHIGFEDAVKGTHKNIKGINFGASSPDPMFANMRAYIYSLAAKLVKAGFYISYDSLKEELRAQQWIVDGNGKRALIPKRSIKTLLGKSPDESDAFAVGCYEDLMNVDKKSNEYYNKLISKIK
jgi:hypothetical protein